jgi:hypothetical protein
MNKKLETRLNLLNDMREIFYTLPGCSCGGPLHVVLDDGNMLDNYLISAQNKLHEPEYESHRFLGLAIVQELMMLSPAQRYLWWSYADFKEIEAAKDKVLMVAFDEDHTYEVRD